MTIRTTESTVSFRHPFMLTPLDRPQPAGIYRLVIDEEEIQGLSFLAYRRTATMLHTPAISSAVIGTHQVYWVDQAELATALESDVRSQPSLLEGKN